MTAGHGIAHSEVSTPETTVLHGVQLWVVLPEAQRDMARGFEHFAPTPAPLPQGVGEALVFIGGISGLEASPIATCTPLLGAELRLVPGAEVSLAVDPRFEHALLVDSGRDRR